jgi:dUTP pyrophosphatase
MVMLKAYKLYPDVQIPKHATVQAACFDVRAYLGQPLYEVTGFCANNKECKSRIFDTTEGSRYIKIDPGQRLLIPTGIIFDIPKGYSVRIHARSGLALKQGLVMANSQGIIDSDYVEESKIMLLNISSDLGYIYHGDRVAQAELVRCEQYNIMETTERPTQKTDRNGGFGSTGVTQ